MVYVLTEYLSSFRLVLFLGIRSSLFQDRASQVVIGSCSPTTKSGLILTRHDVTSSVCYVGGRSDKQHLYLWCASCTRLLIRSPSVNCFTFRPGALLTAFLQVPKPSDSFYPCSPSDSFYPCSPSDRFSFHPCSWSSAGSKRRPRSPPSTGPAPCPPERPALERRRSGRQTTSPPSLQTPPLSPSTPPRCSHQLKEHQPLGVRLAPGHQGIPQALPRWACLGWVSDSWGG
jgi:hypothetical protein